MTDPKQPVVDLNQTMQGQVVLLCRSRLQSGKTLEVLGSSRYREECPSILRAYDVILETLYDVTGIKWAGDIQVVVLYAGKEKPANYVYRCAPFAGHQDCLVMSDKSPLLLYAFCKRSAHELTHDTHRIISGQQTRHSAWFEEGLAQYVSLRCLERLLPQSYEEDKTDAVAAFTNADIRARLWSSWSTSPIDRSRFSFPASSAKEVEAFWRPIDEGYLASLGAFVYMEKTAGKEKLDAVIREVLAQKHASQDDSFYKDLADRIGFDIREVGQDQIGRTFSR